MERCKLSIVVVWIFVGAFGCDQLRGAGLDGESVPDHRVAVPANEGLDTCRAPTCSLPLDGQEVELVATSSSIPMARAL